MSTVQPITGRQTGELCRLLEERGVGFDEFQARFIEGINDVVGWLRGDQQVYPIAIDYGRSLEEIIVAGCYDWKSSDINSKNFPFKSKGKGIVNLDARLVRFGRAMKDGDAVIAELDKMGFRPAAHEELLAFGEKYPGLQRQFPIVALGSSALLEGYRFAVVLWSSFSGERLIYLIWFRFEWPDYYRFLAVRK